MTTTRVLLLRGVNVGGSNRLPMPEFRKMLAEQGLEQVQTYLQSGNAVFADPGIADIPGKVKVAMLDRFGFCPTLFLMDVKAYEAVLTANPFKEQGRADGTAVHLFFLNAALPKPDQAVLTAALAAGEALKITDAATYLHAPAGIARSAVAGKLAALAKPSASGRNMTSALAIAALARGMAA